MNTIPYYTYEVIDTDNGNTFYGDIFQEFPHETEEQEFNEILQYVNDNVPVSRFCFLWFDIIGFDFTNDINEYMSK